MQTIIWLFMGLLLLGGVVPSTEAHEPFDCSSRLSVADDEVRIEVMMGMDGVREIVPAAGFSTAEFKNIVLMRPRREAIDLPAAFSAWLFEVNIGGEKLNAKAVKAHCDGTEVVFILTYPRPAAGTLNLRAAYFDSATSLRPGSFVASDESRNRLKSSLLSRTNLSIQISMPALHGAKISGSLAVTNAATSRVEPERKPKRHLLN